MRTTIGCVAALVMAAGCGGEQTSNSNPGGWASLIYVEYPSVGPDEKGFTANVELYEDHVVHSTTGGPKPIDSCWHYSGSHSTQARWADVGPTMDLAAQGASLVLQRMGNPGWINYRGSALYDDAATYLDREYGLSISSIGGSIRVPPRLVVTAPAVANDVVVGDSALPIEWMPVGADQLVIASVRWGCRVVDDGSFVVPAEFMRDQPGGYITIYAADYADVTFKGAPLEAVGASAVAFHVVPEGTAFE